MIFKLHVINQFKLPEKFHFGLALSISSNEKTGGASGGATGVGGSAALARIRRHDLLFLCWTTGSTKGCKESS